MKSLKDTVSWRMTVLAVLALVVFWLVYLQSGRISLSLQEASLGHLQENLQENIQENLQENLPEDGLQESVEEKADRPLILYAYSESETARPNLEFFLSKGLHGAADFVFILNGKNDVRKLIPDRENIRVVERDNTCFDLGSMGEVLRKDNLWKNYKRFITMNASIRGPFLPIYLEACWSDLFFRRLSDTVKLVGTTVNCIPAPHVQSMLWATDEVSMGILLDPDLAYSSPAQDWGGPDDPVGLSFCHPNMYSAVHTEIGATRLIRQQGYEIDGFLTSYAPATDLEDYCRNGPTEDVLYNGKYFGSNVHPYETIFIKANRDLDPTLLEKMTEWHMARPLDSWATCGFH